MITLEYIKQHTRVEYEEDDEYLSSLIEVAAAYTTSVSGVANDAEAPPAYRHACCILVGHLYANREATSPIALQKLPCGYDMLLASFRKVQVSA